MAETTPPPDPQHSRSSRNYVFVILGIIVLSLVAFMVFRPDPGGRAPTTPATQK
jgi:hypothetical protein